MWKPMLICMLATVCMLACEKESPEAYHETEYMSTSEISVDIDQIDTNAQGASIYSSLNELNSIGICYTTSEMSTYASPLICVTETNGYFLWNTPEEAAQQVTAYLREVNNFAAKTPFSTDDVLTLSKYMQAVGVAMSQTQSMGCRLQTLIKEFS